jgi:hypothetical protein
MTVRSSRCIIASAVLILLSGLSPSWATDYPWCTRSGEAGVAVCGYSSYEQCRASARSCYENPFVETRPQGRQRPGPRRGTKPP